MCIRDRHHGGKGPWPAFDGISVSGMATALGCPARTVTDHDALLREFDTLLPALADRTEPLVLEVAVEADATFRP